MTDRLSLTEFAASRVGRRPGDRGRHGLTQRPVGALQRAGGRVGGPRRAGGRAGAAAARGRTPVSRLADGAVGVLVLGGAVATMAGRRTLASVWTRAGYANTAAKIADTRSLHFAVPALDLAAGGTPRARQLLPRRARHRADLPGRRIAGLPRGAFAVPDVGGRRCCPITHRTLPRGWRWAIALAGRAGWLGGRAVGRAWLLAAAALARASFGGWRRRWRSPCWRSAPRR